MKTFNIVAGALALAFTASAARAQVHLNELYLSHMGTDTEEFIELKGTPNLLLANYMVLFVEGDQTAGHNEGKLKFALDLSALSIPASGYFVIGDSNVTPNQLQIGTGGPPTANGLENGTSTYYLITATMPSAITALVGTNVDTGVGMNTTILPTMAGVTIEDLVAVTDMGVSDITYDGAPTFADTGNFIPAGLFRGGDYPSPWCAQYLDFDPAVNMTQPRTPGAVNSPCPGSIPGIAFCFGDGIDPMVTTPCPCGNTGAAGHGCANSVDVAGALLTATGSTAVDPMTGTDTVVLHASQMPATVSSIFLKGSGVISTGAVFGDGLRCAGGTLIRLGQVVNVGGAADYPGVGQMSISVKGGTPTGSGMIGYYQTYYRNASATFCPPATFNVTNGWQITW